MIGYVTGLRFPGAVASAKMNAPRLGGCVVYLQCIRIHSWDICIVTSYVFTRGIARTLSLALTVGAAEASVYGVVYFQRLIAL